MSSCISFFPFSHFFHVLLSFTASAMFTPNAVRWNQNHMVFITFAFPVLFHSRLFSIHKYLELPNDVMFCLRYHELVFKSQLFVFVTLSSNPPTPRVILFIFHYNNFHKCISGWKHRSLLHFWCEIKKKHDSINFRFYDCFVFFMHFSWSCENISSLFTCDEESFLFFIMITLRNSQCNAWTSYVSSTRTIYWTMSVNGRK